MMLDKSSGKSERVETAQMDKAAQARQAGRLEVRGAVLVVLSGADVGRVIPLDVDEISLGRDDSCQVCVPDEWVSRRHARLLFRPDRSWEIQDLGSSNGTVVNGERTAARVLRDGDRLLCGHTVFKFQAQAEVDEDYVRRIHELWVRDALPQVHDRCFLDDRLRVEVAYARRHGTLVSLLLVQVDESKAVKDGHGGGTGNQVLRQVAASMQGRIRAEDLLARFSDEGFAILAREIPSEGAWTLAERVRRGIEGLTVKHESGDVRVTVSIGVATVKGSPNLTEAALVEAAGRLLHEAKEGRGNRTCAWLVALGPAKAATKKVRVTEVTEVDVADARRKLTTS
jgi:diguanylate cyclase (GGDEF)-like protein